MLSTKQKGDIVESLVANLITIQYPGRSARASQ